jgi:hypothetical protein
VELGALEQNDRSARNDAYRRLLRTDHFDSLWHQLMVDLRRFGNSSSVAWLYTKSIAGVRGNSLYAASQTAVADLTNEGTYPAEFTV